MVMRLPKVLVSLMENKVEFHGKAPTPEEVARALEELA